MRPGLFVFTTFTAASTFTVSALAQDFTVKRASNDEVVLQGSLSEDVIDPPTGLPVKFADFSELKEVGEYYVEVDGVGRSVAFPIDDCVYDAEFVNVMRAFYGWRSGIDISFEYQGQRFEHEAGHLDDALLDFIDDQEGVVKDGTGGWYDAGDFGKYMPTASVAVNSMLLGWELFSDRLKSVELPFIPEHGSELPDYLSELKWELDWMLKMTYDDGSGRVHHKINSPSFPQFVLPADDPTTRYFATFSTAATAEFVATMAKAARVFAPFDEVTNGYSEQLLQAALRSYEYLREHPDDVQYNYSEIPAGEYRKVDTADRLWAAAELWETTGDADALADFEDRISTTTSFVSNFDWDTTTNFGLLTYTLSQRDDRNEAIAAQLEQALLDVANEISETQKASGYGRGFRLFYWGTNGVVARLCLLLQGAYQLDPRQRYLDACSAQLGYLYGRNQYNRSQVTGSGVEPPLAPHHRASGADDVEPPYPGLLVGGGTTPTGWRDVQGDARNNEVAINWNSALVFALAGFVSGNPDAEGVGSVRPEACEIRLNSLGYLPSHKKVATVVDDCVLGGGDFECTVGDTTFSGEVDGTQSVIDDMEDDDLNILQTKGRSGSWFSYTDGSQGTQSSIQVEDPDRAGSQSAVCISGGDFRSWGGGMGFGLATVGATRQSYDASSYTGLRFWAKGSPVEFRAQLVDKYSDPSANLCSGCFDHFRVLFTPSDEWQEFTFAWSDFEQQGFGDPQPSVCPSDLRAIQFQWPANVDFELCLDDIAFTSATQSNSNWRATGGGGCACSLEARATPRAIFLVLLGLGGFAARRAHRRHSLPTVVAAESGKPGARRG